ncbi:MAG: MFS transporter [Reyranellaceae bacterium]
MQDTRLSLGTAQQARLAALWFAMFAQWLAVLPVILPDQVAAIVGRDSPDKEGAIGSIAAAGALIALVVAPIAGALSDRWRGPRGRRRPFLIAGCLGSMVSLMLLAPFGPGSSLALYVLAIVNLQVWWNVVSGAYAGLVPDVVPVAQQPTASAWLNVMTIAGTIAGNVVAAATYASGHAALSLAIFAAATLVGLGLTLSVREPPAAGAREPLRAAPFLRSFWIDPRAHADFYWVLVTRLLSNMGVWSVLTFLLSYLQDMVGVADPERVLPMLLGGGALLAIPASLLGVRLADRLGLVAVVRATSWVMAATATGYVLVALQPSLLAVVPLVLVYAASYGAYQAVDWALALRVLPSRAAAGKDMGIWHVSMVLPQVVGPATTGWLISGARQFVSVSFGYVLAFALAAAWFALAAWLVGRVRLREPVTPPDRPIAS